MSQRVDGNYVSFKNFHNKGQTIGSGYSLDIVRDLYRLQILHKEIFIFLDSYMKLYNDGEFDTFQNALPESVVMQLVSKVNNSELIRNVTVETLKNFKHDVDIPDKYVGLANEVTNIMRQVLAERTRINILETNMEQCDQYKDILEDPVKLRAYLEELQKTSFLFSAEATFDTPIVLKLWYQVYLERYGPPGDGVFDSELLGGIIQELIANGDITEDEVTA